MNLSGISKEWARKRQAVGGMVGSQTNGGGQMGEGEEGMLRRLASKTQQPFRSGAAALPGFGSSIIGGMAGARLRQNEQAKIGADNKAWGSYADGMKNSFGANNVSTSNVSAQNGVDYGKARNVSAENINDMTPPENRVDYGNDSAFKAQGGDISNYDQQQPQQQPQQQQQNQGAMIPDYLFNAAKNPATRDHALAQIKTLQLQQSRQAMIAEQDRRRAAAKPRAMLKGADGYQYYQDDGSRVLPDVQRPESAKTMSLYDIAKTKAQAKADVAYDVKSKDKKQRLSQTGAQIGGMLGRLSQVKEDYSKNVIENAIGKWQGDDNSLLGLSRIGGWIKTMGSRDPSEVRARIKGDMNTLSASLKGVARTPGEGNFTDKDQDVLLAQIGDLPLSKDMDEYSRRINDIKLRIEAGYGLNLGGGQSQQRQQDPQTQQPQQPAPLQPAPPINAEQAPALTATTTTGIAPPPKRALTLLQQNSQDPAIRQAFDQKFGEGAAARALQQGSQMPSVQPEQGNMPENVPLSPVQIPSVQRRINGRKLAY